MQLRLSDIRLQWRQRSQTSARPTQVGRRFRRGDYLAGFAGGIFHVLATVVYEVLEFNGQYKLLVAMEPPGGLAWGVNVEISGIPVEMAIAFQKSDRFSFRPHYTGWAPHVRCQLQPHRRPGCSIRVGFGSQHNDSMIQ